MDTELATPQKIARKLDRRVQDPYIRKTTQISIAARLVHFATFQAMDGELATKL